MDRSAVSQALAKAIAYQEAGKPEQASLWALRLIVLLKEGGIFLPEV